MKKTISIILIVLGIIMILMPLINDIIITILIDKTIGAFESFDSNDLKANQNNDASFNGNEIEELDFTMTLRDIKDIDTNLIIGQVIIPSIDLKLPILKGLSNANLLAGAGTMEEGQVMGSGNYCLAGHYNKRDDTLFGGLMNIEVGDKILLTDKETVFEYTVFNTVVVKDTDVYLILDDEAKKHEKPIVSLMTCYYSSKTGKRFFAIGELTDEYNY